MKMCFPRTRVRQRKQMVTEPALVFHSALLSREHCLLQSTQPGGAGPTPDTSGHFGGGSRFSFTFISYWRVQFDAPLADSYPIKFLLQQYLLLRMTPWKRQSVGSRSQANPESSSQYSLSPTPQVCLDRTRICPSEVIFQGLSGACSRSHST